MSYLITSRNAFVAVVEDNEATITVMKPFSSEISHNGQYILIYEDAFGDIYMKFMTLDEIRSKYMIDYRDMEDQF